jgi:N-formylmaleamate deformylase
MEWAEGDVAVPGARLHYYRRGKGRPLVLAHGATDNGRCWTRVAERIEDSFDIVAYDARYHGHSETNGQSFGGGGADLIDVVEALGLEQPAAMGHSMGAASVAQALAQRPELFQAAVLEDPPWGLPLTVAEHGEQTSEAVRARSALADLMNEQRKGSFAEIVEHGRAQSPDWHPDEFGPWAESKLQFRPPDAWMPLSEPSGLSWKEQVKAFRCPVLLICGRPERQAIVNLQTADEAAVLCPTLDVVRFDAGHNIRREAFEQFVATVRDFLVGAAASP